MQRIRPALRQLQSDIGVEHALASQKLYTDGAELLFDYLSVHMPGVRRSRVGRQLGCRPEWPAAPFVAADRVLPTAGSSTPPTGTPRLIRVAGVRATPRSLPIPTRAFGAADLRAWRCSGRRCARAFLGRRAARRAVGRVRGSGRPARGRASCRIPTQPPDLFLDRSLGRIKVPRNCSVRPDCGSSRWRSTTAFRPTSRLSTRSGWSLRATAGWAVFMKDTQNQIQPSGAQRGASPLRPVLLSHEPVIVVSRDGRRFLDSE